MSSAFQQADSDRNIGVEVEIENCMNALPDPLDRRILSLWLVGESHSNIAEQVNVETSAVRKRWERIRSHLKQRLQPGVC